MSYRIALVVGAFGAAAATALAAATPVTPPPGAYIDASSPPVFSWTLPENERSDALLVANKPITTAAGTFPDGNVVRTHPFSADETTWAPTAPFYAGRYWWLVASRDRDTAVRYYSAPSDFTIGLSFEFDRSQVLRSLSQHWLRLTPHWSGNMRTVKIKVSVLLGRRLLWTRTRSKTNRIGSTGSTSFTWHRPPGIEQGTALHVREGFSMPGTSGGAGDGFGVKAP